MIIHVRIKVCTIVYINKMNELPNNKYMSDVVIIYSASYKEMQISVRNVTWDLMLKKTYMDGGITCPPEDVPDSSWDSNMQKATFTDGVVNDPNGKGIHF